MTETPTEREGRGGLQSQRGDTQSGKKAEDRRLQTGMASSSGTSWKVGRAKVGGPGAAPGSHGPRRGGRGPESESVISPGPALDPTTTSRPDFPGVPLKGMETGRGGSAGGGPAQPSLCRRARPVEHTPQRISPAGRYRSRPAKLDTRGL